MKQLRRHSDDDKSRWRSYWSQQGQLWRYEPEIDMERRAFLVQRYNTLPSRREGIYPFRGIKLSRADIEWLLAIYTSEQESTDPGKMNPRRCKGLDLRGADLRNENLSRLPLAGLNSGLHMEKLLDCSDEQREWAATHLEGANLHGADLEGSTLIFARFEGANLSDTYLEGADLRYAHLQGADLKSAHLEGINLRYAHLERAALNSAHLESSRLSNAHLEGASLIHAHLEGAILSHAHLQGTYLNRAFFDSTTELYGTEFGDKKSGYVSLNDVNWANADLTVINWSAIPVLGDEHRALQWKSIENYLRAVRAYRQLATVLRNQGLNEDAARFAYRAQFMQRKVFWHQRKFGQYLFSLFLDLLAGYGYKPLRSFIA